MVQKVQKPFLVGQCLGDTWELACRHLPFLFGLFLILGLPLGSLGVANGWTELSDKATQFLLLPWAISLLWGIHQRESGYRVSLLQSAWQGIRLLPRLVGFQFLSGLALLCSAICLLLPAVYVWVSLSVGAALAVAHGHTVDEVMTRSFELTKRHLWKLLFFWMIFGALSGFFMFGNLSLLDTLEFAGVLSPSKLKGWPTAIWELLIQAQVMALGHIAGLAILKQILPASGSAEESEPLGLNPVDGAE